MRAPSQAEGGLRILGCCGKAAFSGRNQAVCLFCGAPSSSHQMGPNLWEQPPLLFSFFCASAKRGQRWGRNSSRAPRNAKILLKVTWRSSSSTVVETSSLIEASDWRLLEPYSLLCSISGYLASLRLLLVTMGVKFGFISPNSNIIVLFVYI